MTDHVKPVELRERHENSHDSAHSRNEAYRCFALLGMTILSPRRHPERREGSVGIKSLQQLASPTAFREETFFPVQTVPHAVGHTPARDQRTGRASIRYVRASFPAPPERHKVGAVPGSRRAMGQPLFVVVSVDAGRLQSAAHQASASSSASRSSTIGRPLESIRLPSGIWPASISSKKVSSFTMVNWV